MRWLSLRALFMLGFAVGMPVLALPPVARWIDDLLYGPPPADFGLPPAVSAEAARSKTSAATTSSPQEPGLSRASPAGNVSSRSQGTISPKEPDSTANEPHLSQTPEFAQNTPSPYSSTPETQGAGPTGSELVPLAASRIREETIARLQAIRQRLEVLGAEYVLVETLAEGGRFRFHCRMRVDAESPYTRPFEASSFDPVAAGEDVLRQVETWRQARLATPAQDVPRR